MAKAVLDIGGYSLIKRIGTGARSTIYLATDQSTKENIALKRIIFEKPEDQRILEQVETEFKVAKNIDHPYIRKCYKIKKIRNLLTVKELLMSMEYFEGDTLEHGSSLSLIDVLLVFRMVALGLNAMHQAGYVHCDIKPNNILLNKSGSIKIIDLGQSCKIGTKKLRIQGTPDYIAPEQVHRKSLVPKTDIFNLGATIYWALTGENVPTMIPKKNALGFPEPQKACKPPHEIRDKIPVVISNFVMQCVKNDPAERPMNMAVVISKLDTIIHSILASKAKLEQNAPADD